MKPEQRKAWKDHRCDKCGCLHIGDCNPFMRIEFLEKKIKQLEEAVEWAYSEMVKGNRPIGD
jgi:hypothetical protein